MYNARGEILQWMEEGRIAPERARRAMEAGGVLPTAGEWRRFLDLLLLFMGATMLAAGVIFFLAYNWQDLGRYAKFALVEAGIAIALVLVWSLGLERASGKAALLVAALLAGALLALVGQTYQTGADTFELFAAWAIAILPWALVSRFPALWVLWLAIVNLAVTLYFQAFRGWFGIVFGPEQQVWVLFALNTAALVAWEASARLGLVWLSERWAARLIATAGGALVTSLAIIAIFDSRSGWGALAWLAWLGAAYAAYRSRLKDVYVLAGGVLSVIVVVTAFLTKHLFRTTTEAGGLLLIGLIVIGLSAAGSYWLRTVVTEDRP